MERNQWTLATVAIALIGMTALGTGLTTAWMLRPAAPAEATPQAAPAVPSPTARSAMAYATPATSARPRVAPAVAHPAVTPAVARTDTPAAVTRVATTVPADCASGADRAMRIAKPGALGALIGAGLGAAGGAVVKGGNGAGKGALLGGLAGAALGAGYGAYKTQNECGTIFGKSGNGVDVTSASAHRVEVMAPAAPASDADRIEVYRVQR